MPSAATAGVAGSAPVEVLPAHPTSTIANTGARTRSSLMGHLVDVSDVTLFTLYTDLKNLVDSRKCVFGCNFPRSKIERHRISILVHCLKYWISQIKLI